MTTKKESAVLKEKLAFAQQKKIEQLNRARNWYEYVGQTLEMITEAQ